MEEISRKDYAENSAKYKERPSLRGFRVGKNVLLPNNTRSVTTVDNSEIMVQRYPVRNDIISYNRKIRGVYIWNSRVDVRVNRRGPEAVKDLDTGSAGIVLRKIKSDFALYLATRLEDSLLAVYTLFNKDRFMGQKELYSRISLGVEEAMFAMINEDVAGRTLSFPSLSGVVGYHKRKLRDVEKIDGDAGLSAERQENRITNRDSILEKIVEGIHGPPRQEKWKRETALVWETYFNSGKVFIRKGKK